MHIGSWIQEFLVEERLPESFLQVVMDVHAPLARRIAAAARSRDTTVVGLCGSQGSGKSTMAALLKRLLEADGLRVAALSLDDLYLPHAERVSLGQRVHPLLKTRGVPGTHDVPLGLEILAKLRQPGHVSLPSFDKARDDRRDRAGWPVAEGPSQIVIFEGWCMGAVPQATETLAAPINELEQRLDEQGIWRRYVNDALRGGYRQLFGQLGMLILLQAPGFEVVYRWRLEQEHKLRDRVGSAGGDLSRVMSDEQVRHFISHYERLTRHILSEMPSRADVVIRLDEQRRPLT